jgi:mannose-6-phosphate isomerase
MLYPLTFYPIFKERIWGGRKLEQLYHKALPAGVPIGESWEISDRPGEASVIANGPLAGKDLRWLMENHARELLGAAPSQSGKFPLLIKILDAQQKLSLQVHPPAHKAAQLGGEPKTEMWYLADAAPDAELFVGLKRGVTRAQFERELQAGSVADCFHRIKVQKGDALFLPSGRVHALGAGMVIFEIQQNSDTTYRVFDWNRVGLDGKPRALHIPQSLASIDFNDFEPALIQSKFIPVATPVPLAVELPDEEKPSGKSALRSRPLVCDPLFKVDVLTTNLHASMSLLEDNKVKVIGVLEGKVKVSDGSTSVELKAGQFCLIPAALAFAELWADPDTTFLLVQSGE